MKDFAKRAAHWLYQKPLLLVLYDLLGLIMHLKRAQKRIV